MTAKSRQLALVATAQALAMSLWFSASAVVPQLAERWQLDSGAQAWLTTSVQLGFVVGALLSALGNLSDRLPAPGLFAASAVLGAVANLAIIAADGPFGAIVLRLLTGIALAGVYPPGMKIAASWSKRGRGFTLGLVVGALTLGTALPHLLAALPVAGGAPSWRAVLIVASGLALVAALLGARWVAVGPYVSRTAPFDARLLGRLLADRPTRLVNLGYLGHMWELYAMWTWIPVFLVAAYSRAGLGTSAGRVAAFATVAAGGVGCLVAGWAADRIGRTTVVIASLAMSGSCALVVGLFAHRPVPLTTVCLVWGFAVVADSPQLSAAASELADARYVGTALTVQLCLGFLLTMVSIRLLPALAAVVGWRFVFASLAIGPAVGILAMRALRRSPAAARLAGGAG